MANWNKLLYETDATASVNFATIGVASAEISSAGIISATISSLNVNVAVISSLGNIDNLIVANLSVTDTVSFNSAQLQNARIETTATVSDLNAITPLGSRFMAVTSTEHLYVYF